VELINEERSVVVNTTRQAGRRKQNRWTQRILVYVGTRSIINQEPLPLSSCACRRCLTLLGSNYSITTLFESSPCPLPITRQLLVKTH
jgi:hypothetical protein